MMRKTIVVLIALVAFLGLRQYGVFEKNPDICLMPFGVSVAKSEVGGKSYEEISTILAQRWLAVFEGRPQKCMRFWLDDYSVDKVVVDGTTLELENFSLEYSVKTYFFSDGQWNGGSGLREVDGWVRGKMSNFKVVNASDAFVLTGITPKI